jgi:hypothetical protein
MKKWILLLTIAALACWIPGQAGACPIITCDNFDSPFTVQQTGGTLDTPDSGSWGNLHVNLIGSPLFTDYSLATICIKPENGFQFVGSANYHKKAAAVNVNGDFDHLLVLTPFWSANTNGGTFDGLGNFDIILKNCGGFRSAVTFTMVGMWTDASEVLAFNELGFDAGMALKQCNTTKCGTVGEVPLPGAVLLLGAGMARLVAYARRKRQN